MPGTVFINQAKGDSLAEMMLESMYELIGDEGEFAILSSTADRDQPERLDRLHEEEDGGRAQVRRR